MRAASYFQLLVYSHRVTTAGSSACLLWQIFHAGCSNSDCAQRDGNNRVLKLSRTRQGLKGYAGRSELQHRWLCTSSVVKSSGEQWNELRIKITLFALCICFSIILSCVFLGQQQLWHKESILLPDNENMLVDTGERKHTSTMSSSSRWGCTETTLQRWVLQGPGTKHTSAKLTKQCCITFE